MPLMMEYEMPRPRAEDYDTKRTAILDAAATLFANRGYAGCKMQDIAKECSVSKSMLYHYFAKKEDVLFEILKQHLDRLFIAIEEHSRLYGTIDLDDFFSGFVKAYLEKSSLSRARHVVALHDRRYLTEDQHEKIVVLERAIVSVVEKILRKVAPSRAESEFRPHALLLIGMINWVELWYRRAGKVSPTTFYGMITKLYLHGYATSPSATLQASS